MSNGQRLSRRAFLRTAAAGGLGLGGALLASCGASTPAAPGGASAPAAPQASDSFSWTQFSGTTINVLLLSHPWSAALEQQLPAFEELTGMQVAYEIIPEQQARQKLVVDLAGGGTIDVFSTSLHVEKRRFATAGWYEPLGPYLANPQLTAPTYAFDGDLFGGSRSAATGEGSSTLALPAFTDPWVYFYRQDLLDAAGLTPPATLDEMAALAEALHRPPEQFGYVARGLKNANAIGYTWMLRSLGGSELTAERQANLTTPEAVRAMELYAGLLRQYAPPGVVSFNWQECASAFSQGQVASYFDGVNFAPQFEDPSKSTVSGKVGYAVLPAGPAGQIVPAFTTAVAVSALSRQKEPGYLFAQWATSPETAVALQRGGVGTARPSAWADPQVQNAATMPQAWTDAYMQSLELAQLGLPEIVGVTEYRDIIGVAIQQVIEGADAATALATAQEEFQAMLESTEPA